MLIWDDARTTSQRLAQDTSTETISFLDLMMNIGYKDILVALGRQVTELERTVDLTSGARSVQVPPDCVFIKSMYVLSGTTIYPVTEEPSSELWSAMKSGQQQGVPTKFHFKPRFGVGGGVIELNPIPSSDDYDLVLTFEATQRDLGNTKYATGTVAINEGETTVTGSGTTFTAAMVGRYLNIPSVTGDGLFYRIDSFTDATHLELEQLYQGEDVSGTAYQICEMFALPEDMQMLPVYFALWQHWDSKGNLTRAAKYESQFNKGVERGKKIHSLTTRDNRIGNEGYGLGFPQNAPSYFPANVSS